MDPDQLKAILKIFQYEQAKTLDQVTKAQNEALEKVTNCQKEALDQVKESVTTLKGAVEAIRNPEGGPREGNDAGGGREAPKTRQWQMLSIFVKSQLDLDDQDAEKFQSWRESFETFLKNANFRPANQVTLETNVLNGAENAVHERNVANEDFF